MFRDVSERGSEYGVRRMAVGYLLGLMPRPRPIEAFVADRFSEWTHRGAFVADRFSEWTHRGAFVVERSSEWKVRSERLARST